MELPEEDRPHENIWLNPDALNAHFEFVKARRQQRSGKGDEVEQVPMFDVDDDARRLRDSARRRSRRN